MIRAGCVKRADALRREGQTKREPKRGFTIGINDDVSHTGLTVDTSFDIGPPEIVRGLFFGTGADGTVGAKKNSTKILAGGGPDRFAQGDFVYHSKKSGSYPISHLRWFLNSAGELRCDGPTGAITRLWHGKQVRIVTSLPLHAPPGGTFAGEINDISFHGVGGMFLAMGLGNDPAVVRPVLRAAGNMPGTLLQVNAGGGRRIVADVAAYEAAADPNGGLIASNPSVCSPRRARAST